MIDGLAEAIREKGLPSTQISDIVRHARASRSTFYRCFDDKDSCFVALAEELVQQTLVQVAQAVDLTAPAETQVDQTVDSFLAIVEADPAVKVTISSDASAFGPGAAQLRAETIEQFARFIHGLAHGPAVQAEMGSLSHVTIEASFMLICGIEGLIDRAVRSGQDLNELAPTVKTVVKRVLAP